MRGYRPHTPLAQRFAAKVRKAEGDACWEWTGALNGHGYGSIRGEGPNFPMLGAHRVAWELENGPIREGLYACHRCDNRKCVRAEHLFLGTAEENNADRNAKGRSAHNSGVKQGAAKLDDAKVLQIRKAYAEHGTTQAALAATYGVTRAAVYRVVSGQTWKHLLAEAA